MPAARIGSVVLTDDLVGRHFGHHVRFTQRHPGRSWRFTKLRARVSELRCLYDDPGVKPANAAGLMGAAAAPPTGYCDALISEMANTMLDTMDRYYTAQGLVTVSGGFKLQVAAALETIRRTPDPRDWVRAHSVALLGTRDPEDEPFHLALASGFTIGSPLVREIESLL